MTRFLLLRLLVVCAIFFHLAPVNASLGFLDRPVESTSRYQRDISILNVCGRKPKTEDELGSGAYGDVYLVPLDEEKPERGLAVLKEPSAEYKPEILKEIKYYLKVGDHPNLPKLLGFCKNPKAPLLLLEYVQGSTLKSWLKSNFPDAPVPVEMQYKILSQLADALYWIERRKVIHDDTHDGNIMIVDDKNQFLIKLIDFGLAKDRADSRVTRNLQKEVRSFCDIAWRLAQGDSIFWFHETIAEQVNHLARKYQDNGTSGPSNPKWVAQIIRMCQSAMRKDEKKRWTSIRRFAKFLGGLSPRQKKKTASKAATS